MIIKKLLVVALLLLSSWVEAQSTLKAVSLRYGERVTVDDPFEWDKLDTGLNIPVHISEDNTITIYSKEKQKYIAIDAGENLDQHSTMWKTIDIDGNRCNIYMTYIDNSLYLLVEYRTIGWYYELVEY
jgi:hypothetical protein